MAPKLQPVRGTHDILPEEAWKRRFIIDTAQKAALLYGFGEIATPVFEFTDVFLRTLGDTSDVVTKETYTFEDRGGESLTLRPEFTAAVVRALISNGLQNELPVKWLYHGPAFRYERPQKGRLRQFHQFGVELLGVAEPSADVEVIALAAHILEALGLKSRVVLELNSLGDTESRQAYRAALVEYFNDHAKELSPESQARLAKNPLRILDSKDENDRKINALAPVMHSYFTAEAKEFFEAVEAGLSAFGIEYRLNAKLVRGLDYYNHTVFEFTCDALGAQNTVLAGGRYDGLVEQMGGPSIPGIGFAAGIERLLLAMEEAIFPAEAPPVAIVPISEAEEAAAWKLAQELRAQGFAVDIGYKGNAGKRMKRADKLGCRIALLLGSEEMAKNAVTLKNLSDGTQEMMDKESLIKKLSQ